MFNIIYVYICFSLFFFFNVFIVVYLVIQCQVMQMLFCQTHLPGNNQNIILRDFTVSKTSEDLLM